jgi:hypothetical protein
MDSVLDLRETDTSMLAWRSCRSPLVRMQSRITKLRDKPGLRQTLALQYGPAYVVREMLQEAMSE